MDLKQNQTQVKTALKYGKIDVSYFVKLLLM